MPYSSYDQYMVQLASWWITQPKHGVTMEQIKGLTLPEGPELDFASLGALYRQMQTRSDPKEDVLNELWLWVNLHIGRMFTTMTYSQEEVGTLAICQSFSYAKDVSVYQALYGETGFCEEVMALCEEIPSFYPHLSAILK